GGLPADAQELRSRVRPLQFRTLCRSAVSGAEVQTAQPCRYPERNRFHPTGPRAGPHRSLIGPDMNPWNEQLRQRRLQRRLTQEEFATELARVAWEQNRERIGVDAAMVSKWERGKKQPSHSYRRLLAALFVTDPISFD